MSRFDCIFKSVARISNSKFKFKILNLYHLLALGTKY